MNIIRIFLTGIVAIATVSVAQAQDYDTDTGGVASVQEYPDMVHYRSAVRSYKSGFNDHAREQFMMAARWANKEAQFNLALMYFSGIGTEPDKVRGTAWALLADERGDGRFRKTRIEMMNMLEPAEREQALEQARELKTDYGDLAALERRAEWVRKQKRELTGSRLGTMGSMVRVIEPGAGPGLGGGYAGRGDQLIAHIETFEQELFDVVTTVEYRDFEVLDEEP